MEQRLDLGAALRVARGGDPGSVPDIVIKAALQAGATDIVLYLVDFDQAVLEPLPDRSSHAEVSRAEQVTGSMAGRAFLDQAPVTVERPGGVRVWVPIIEGSDRTGVLALTVPVADDAALLQCEELGLLTGLLIATQARSTDVYNLHRRRRHMKLAASMQWDLLPPLTLTTDAITVAGLLEPAYEVGGDSFDYAVNGSVFDMGVVDAMGHGVGAALASVLTVGCYRHHRRQGSRLIDIHRGLHLAMVEQYRGAAFATGQLIRIDVDTGSMSWTNAGHPLPLLVRGDAVVGPISCPPSLPWGMDLDGQGPTAVATELLEPGDSVLFYTDGVIEATTPEGDRFGLDRLIDLTTQNASSLVRPEEVLRRLMRSVREHQDDDLNDDATLLVVRWNGPPNRA